MLLFYFTIPDIKHLLQPVEDVIRHKFIPTLCDNRACNNDERLLFALPVRYGGLGITDITAISDIEYNISNELTKELQSKILHQNLHVDQQNIESNTLKKWKTIKGNQVKETLKVLRSKMIPTKLKANEIAQCEGASSWLTTLPLKEEGFALSKREFIDALYLRYGWDVPRLPSICACSKNNSVEHSMSCKHGGFVGLRHNEVRDLTAKLLTEVCKDVSREPKLVNKTNDDDEDLRADISAPGVWQPLQRAFFDVKVLHPLAQSYRNQSLEATFRSMENQKKR